MKKNFTDYIPRTGRVQIYATQGSASIYRSEHTRIALESGSVESGPHGSRPEPPGERAKTVALPAADVRGASANLPAQDVRPECPDSAVPIYIGPTQTSLHRRRSSRVRVVPARPRDRARVPDPRLPQPPPTHSTSYTQ